MSRTLVIRLSALGDVAMLVPVLYAVAVQYPCDDFFLITKMPLLPIFETKPKNLKVIPLDTKGLHKGVFGLWKYIRQELLPLKIDQVADLHRLLRSRQINLFFYLKGKRIEVIDKGKFGKWELTRKKNKVFLPLETSIERYMQTFNRLGYHFSLNFNSILDFGTRDFSRINSFTGQKMGHWIGIAPFAKHKGKILPFEKTDEVISRLVERPGIRIFLFGGKEEEEKLEKWSTQYKQVTSVAGHFSFSDEILLMSQLDVMLTMDSGNMHLASLVAIPVVSIWGATHPYTGFYGYKQDPENIVQVDLFCRPCSVFGEKTCYRKNYECLHRISSEMIINKIDRVISGKL